MKNKMDPKSSVRVFLGYNKKYKGYKCIRPPIRYVLISRHVLVDEVIYPFADMYNKYHCNSNLNQLSALRNASL
ncbi:hypothetical protein Bca4012_063277 [Brassica carinata]